MGSYQQKKNGVSEQHMQFVKQVADMLDEHDPRTLIQIEAIVRRLGYDVSKQLLTETLELVKSGGVMLPDGSRKRTIGGTFFDLAKTKYKEQLPPVALMHHSMIKLPKKLPVKQGKPIVQKRRPPSRQAKPFQPKKVS